MNEQKPVTGNDVRAAMIAADITEIPHHDCSFCGVWTAYLRYGDSLFYRSGCGCSWSTPMQRDWSDAAEWINIQPKPEHRARLRKLFGLPVLEEFQP